MALSHNERNEAFMVELKDIQNIAEIPEIEKLSPGKSVSTCTDDTQESELTSYKPEEKLFLPSIISETNYFGLLKQGAKSEQELKEKPREDLREKADEELWKDLRKEDEKLGGSLLEQKFIKYIFIDSEGKPYVEMPSIYHEDVVDLLVEFVNEPLLGKANGSYKLTNNSQKQPDVLIFGPSRKQENRNRVKKRKLEGSVRRNLNPHAIIEVSWTNNTEDEKAKFILQMTRHNGKYEVINVGYLIKLIPKVSKQYPNEEFPSRPLVGIDVYRMKHGDKEPEEYCRWRHGESYPKGLEITAKQLGEENQGEGVSVSIPLKKIVEQLEESEVKFVKPGTN